MRDLKLFGILAAICVASLSGVRAQTKFTLPGCETRREVRQAIDEKLDSNKLDKMKFVDREAFTRQVLDDLIAKYPREFEPYQTLISMTRWQDPENFPALQERFAKFARENPDDPLALTVAAVALKNKDTPQSIQWLEAAQAKAPEFPRASLELANLYFSGKRADPTKVAANLEVFFSICPGSASSTAQWLLNKDIPLQPKVAAAMRARLEKEKNPKRLQEYETLWGLEFRTRPPAEHDALRKQIALDLSRLEKLNPKGDAEWIAFLIKGYKQSGASQEAVTAVEDRLLRQYPKSDEAYAIVHERWTKANKEPEDQADKAAWEKYDAAHKEALKGWMRDYPDNTYLQRYAWFYEISDDDALPEAEGIAALDHFRTAVADYEAPQYWYPLNAALFLTTHKWQPTRAMDLANRARDLVAKSRQRAKEDDNLSADDAKNHAEGKIWQDQMLAAILLKAARQAGQPQAVASLRASVEGAAPEDKKYLSGYWANRALLADLDNHKQDALTYYQQALQTRLEPEKPWHGKLKDDLADEAHALWKELGGSEAAWSVWSSSPGPKSAELAQGRWEKPTKTIPVFELSDLSGKTWRLKELNGKVLLINLWATWCGPCQAEMPRLQKFYEQNKERSDIQVLSFNLDEDLGLVAPYLKEKGYTFPVLPAYSTVVGLFDGYSIPQNWIVDPKGTWRWTQIGYGGGTDTDFSQEMLARLASVKDQ